MQYTFTDLYTLCARAGLAAVLAAGVFFHSQARDRANGGQTAALAPKLTAAQLPSFPEKTAAVRLLVNGKSLKTDGLQWLQSVPDLVPLTVEIDGVPVQAAYLSQGSFSIAYTFPYGNGEYIVKLPRVFDKAVSEINHTLSVFDRTTDLLDWMVKNRYLLCGQSVNGLGFEYRWTPAGLKAVLDDDPEFYAELARILAAGTYEVRASSLGRSVSRTQARQICRMCFQQELRHSLSARREAEGFGRAYPGSRLPGTVAMIQDTSGQVLTPEAVIQPCFPAVRQLDFVQPATPQSGRVVRAAVEELERIHRLGRVHGDIKPDHLCIDAGLGVRFVDWGSSHTPGQLRSGHIIPMTPQLASPARVRDTMNTLEAFTPSLPEMAGVRLLTHTGESGNYNPFFDDYYGLTASLVWVWVRKPLQTFFHSQPRTLDSDTPAYRDLTYLFPQLPAAFRAWKQRGKTDVHAFTLALLEAACETRELPGYLVWGSPAQYYESVDEIETLAPRETLATAA